MCRHTGTCRHMCSHLGYSSDPPSLGTAMGHTVLADELLTGVTYRETGPGPGFLRDLCGLVRGEIDTEAQMPPSGVGNRGSWRLREGWERKR